MSQVAEAGAALIIFHNNVIDGNVAGAVNAAIGAISTIKELALHTPALSQVALVMNVIDFGQKYQRGEISAASYINLTSSAVATVATFMTVGGVSAIAGIPVAGVLLGATLVGAAAELFPDEVNNIVGAAQNAFNKVATGAALEDAIDGIGDWFLPRALGLGKGPKAISPALGTTPDPIVDGVVYRVMMWADPLVLDLDGDGYEITAISPGVHFDSDGDGLKNKMAWVGADDGLLVLDRNGNGLIDSGRELFGDDTILENGTTAVNGFAALSDLDTSHDGKFDIADEKFLDVRVWKDVNQDGISQDGELFTLSAVGVKSISLSNQQSSESHGDAILNFEGSYERTNGTQGGVGCFIFAQDRFDRVFNPIEISTDAATVLDIKGTGYVRDLQEAATLNPKLIQLFNSVKNAESRADYKAKLSELILEWGLSSEYINASNNALAAGFGLVLSGPEDEQELGWMDVAIKASKTDREAFRSGLSAADQNKFDAMRDRMVGKLESTYAYEAFTAFPFFTWDKILRDATEEDPLMSGGGGQNGNPVETQMPFSQLLRERPIGTFVGVPAGYVLVNIPSPPNNVSNYYDLLWNRLLDDAARNLMPSLRLSGYVNLVDSTLSDHGLNYSFNRLDARLQEITALDKYEGTALALDLFEHFGIAFTELGWLGRETISTLAHQIGNDEAIRRAFIDVGFSFSLGTASSSMAEKFVYIGSSQDNYFSAVGSGADFVYGEAGNDTFYTEAGNDIANGGGGDDYLNSGDGDDILEGGLGDDYLSGGLGSDIYVFGRGDGQDCIYDNGESGSQIDVIKFLPGVNSQDAFIYRDETSLYIAFSNSVDKITISGFFSDKNSQVEAVEFSDGTYWGSNYLQNASYLGAEGSDILSGSNQSEKFYGKDGADSIYAYGGDDTIFGGSGDDSLSGDVGNDTYIFGIGDGQDVIDDSEGDADTIIFGEGINPDRTRIWRDISNLYIGMSDTPDFLSIQSWFDSADHRIEHINFANGTSLDASSFQLAHFIGSADIDNLNGSSGDDYLEGVGGNDVLSGGEGNDSLDGGSGDDYISGDAGNDTYLFDMGAGFDTVFDSAGTDVIQLGEDVRPSDVSIWRDLNNLYIGLNSFNDVLTINGWFDATTNRVESIKFADGTIWAASVLQAAAFGGTLGDDYVYGTTANDKVLGFSGNDYLNPCPPRPISHVKH